MNSIRKAGNSTSTERGTSTMICSMYSSSGVATAPEAQARTMRLRSGRLAKRQMPRYKPSCQAITPCSGTTASSVVNMLVT